MAHKKTLALSLFCNLFYTTDKSPCVAWVTFLSTGSISGARCMYCDHRHRSLLQLCVYPIPYHPDSIFEK
ncbi:hypothetical protein RRG08_046035, partial [Elysia crispata]